MNTVNISIYHDTRRTKANKCYPVKLRVYYNRQTKTYLTGIDLTKEDFIQSYRASKPKNEFKITHHKLVNILAKAFSIREKLIFFTFEKFEHEMFRCSHDINDVFEKYRLKIAALEENEQVKTQIIYECALQSLIKFNSVNGKNFVTLKYSAVTVDFLNCYERWMIKTGCTGTTVSMYVRTLRAIFNDSLRNGEIGIEIYPFGKNKYQIPASLNIKKAIEREELKKLLEYPLDKGCSLDKARAFWFFQANGMNFRDICELKFSSVLKDKIIFQRSKTKSHKINSRSIVVILTPYLKEVIESYGNKNLSPNTYVFPILNARMNAKQRVQASDAFIRFTNSQIKKVAELAGVDNTLSTYHARHSYTTISVQNGATLEFLQESLGHASIQTTMNYWKGFSDDTKKSFANKLMNF
jgi:integrase